MARTLRRSLLFALVLAPFAPVLAPRSARAEGLSQSEIARIERGETVVRSQTVELSGQRYVGGVTYTIVEATPEQLLALMDNEEAYGQVLPRTKFVKRIRVDGADGYMEVHHGNTLIDAAYTMHLRKEPEQSRIRFWVDLTRPHDLEDAWGFFRYDMLPSRGPAPRMLLTYGALVNLGDGIVRSLYEERVRVSMLSVPQKLRGYVSRATARK